MWLIRLRYKQDIRHMRRENTKELAFAGRSQKAKKALHTVRVLSTPVHPVDPTQTVSDQTSTQTWKNNPNKGGKQAHNVRSKVRKVLAESPNGTVSMHKHAINR